MSAGSRSLLTERLDHAFLLDLISVSWRRRARLIVPTLTIRKGVHFKPLLIHATNPISIVTHVIGVPFRVRLRRLKRLLPQAFLLRLRMVYRHVPARPCQKFRVTSLQFRPHLPHLHPMLLQAPKVSLAHPHLFDRRSVHPELRTTGLRIIHLRVRAIPTPRFRLIHCSGGPIEGIDAGFTVPIGAGATRNQHDRCHDPRNKEKLFTGKAQRMEAGTTHDCSHAAQHGMALSGKY